MEPLYQTRTVLESDDYIRYIRRMQGNRKKSRFITILVTAWILFVALVNIRAGNNGIGLFMAAFALFWPLIIRFIYDGRLTKNFAQIRETGGDRFEICFFEDHLETKTGTGGGSYPYTNIYRIIEDKKDFYMELEEGQCLIIQKKNCSDALFSFIRGLDKKPPQKPE